MAAPAAPPKVSRLRASQRAHTAAVSERTTEPADAWHARPSQDALDALGTSSLGLSAAEAAERLARHGPNALPQHRGESPLAILIRQVHNPLIYVLLASTGLAILTGKVFDGLVILGVVVLNSLIGFVQEYRAGRAIQALSAMVPQLATVLRDGRRQSLPAADLVPGDVVVLQSGDKVPADVRLLEARTLKVEEAALTGESVPVEKGLAPVAATAGIGDRRSMAYSGTLVTYGTGTAVVVATGARTELGRISELLKQAQDLETPLTKQLGVIGTWITVGIVAVSVVLLGVGLLRGYALGDAVLAAVTLAVGAIPEGLPAVVTIALAIGVQRMARRRAVIRKLPAVETLGSTTVICSDKTGTLTKNEMTVQALWTPAGAWRLTGVGYAPEGTLATADGAPLDGRVPDSVAALLTAGALCNDAAIERRDGAWTLTGDPTEGALVTAADKLGLEAETLRRQHPRLDAVPFESERQYMATLHREPDGGQAIYVKGAPEVVLRRCTAEGPERAAALAEVERVAAQGMRVLAFAVRRPDGPLGELTEADAEAGFTFLGLQGMIDPPREEAVAAVRACREAGITVKMITGDHHETARAIGEALGLVGPGEHAVTGTELSALADEELREVAARHNVFARVAPEHKLRLVQALQARGEVVAMTGDGVNDAPALKQAGIGVAMGITGTAVSKEASDVVLADDNFASIAAAVEEGRRVYDNLIKALAFLLPTNLGLAVILTVAVAFFPIVDGVPMLPMLPVQILWINLVASVALALPLAFEARERDVMRRPPRRPDAPILSVFVVGRTVVVALLMAAGALGLFLVEYDEALAAGLAPGRALGEAQTMAVTTVILFQIFYLLNCRSLKESILQIGLFSNPWVYVGIGAILVLQLGFVYLPVMNAVFGSAPLPLVSWGEALLVALVVLPVIGLEKRWRRRSGRA